MAGSPRRTGSRWLVLGVAAALTAGGSGPAPPAPPIAAVALVREPPPAPASVEPAPAAAVAGSASWLTALGPAPVRLRIPVLGVDAAVRPVVIDARGALGVPDDPQVVGWWAAGGPPGVPLAAGVLDGHVDSAVQGPGALFHLGALAPGDALSVVAAGGSVTSFVVRVVHRFSKSALPADLLAPGGPPQLVVVTCGGRFDPVTRHYADNVVVVADPAP